MNRFKQFIGFIRDHLWSIPEGDVSTFNRIVLGQIRIIALAIKGAGQDKIFHKAAALTYNTLWALIPVLAMIFAIAKGFGFQDVIDNFINHNFEGNPEVAHQMIELVNKYLETIKGGFLVGIGIVILVWSVINVLGQVEMVFNGIWQNPKSRNFLRKFTDYFSLLILVPIIIIISSGANLYISSKIDEFSSAYGMELVIAPVARFLMQFMPYVLYITLFTILYVIIPNTRVKFISALIPGIIAGTLFQALQIFYFHGQAWFGRIHTVYSGLVALPLLMLYVHIGWSIILVGAEISFSHQNIKNYMYNEHIAKISIGYQRKLTLFIAYIVIQRFKQELPALTAEDIADLYNIPIRLVNRVIMNLTDSGIICELAATDNGIAYQPGVDINILTIQFINDRLDNLGTHDFVPIKTPEFNHLSNLIDKQSTSLHNSKTNVRLIDL